MASAEQYAEWIVSNQDKKGTPEFETVAQAYKVARDEPQQQAAPESSALDRAGRVAGLGVRAAVRGITAIPTLMAEGVAAPLRALTGGKYFPSPSATLARGMTQVGLPEPETPVERFSTDVSSAIGGLSAPLQLARTVASGAGAVPTLGQRIAEQFTRNPLSQGVAATTGGAGASVARESGAGPMGQLAAGLAGALAPSVATSLVSGTANVGRALLDPVHEAGQKRILGGLIRREAGELPEDVIAKLREAQPLIPGSSPTAAQVARSGGIAALERSAAQADAGTHSQRVMEQNAARLNALRNIAGDETKMGAAEAAREQAASPLYDVAKRASVTSDSTLRTLLSRPSMKSAWERALRLAKENGEEIKLGVDEPAKRVEGLILGSSGKPLSSKMLPATNATFTGRGLHYLKMGLDDLLDDPTSSIGKFEKHAIMDTREKLGEWLGTKIPEYATARKTYEVLSKPIAQMKLGQALLQKLEPALTEGNLPVRMRAASYAEALRKGDDLAKQITGFKGATLENTLSAEQIATLKAVRDDLARTAIASDLGRGVGSNTFQNIAQENLFQSAGIQGLPQLLSRPVQLTNYLMRGVYGSANREMRDKLSDVLLDPQATAAAMTASRPGTLQELAARLSQGRGPVAASAPVLFGITPQ